MFNNDNSLSRFGSEIHCSVPGKLASILHQIWFGVATKKITLRYKNCIFLRKRQIRTEIDSDSLSTLFLVS